MWESVPFGIWYRVAFGGKDTDCHGHKCPRNDMGLTI